MASAFKDVRDSFVGRLDANLEKLGIVLSGKGASGEWRAVNCPLCEDGNGSCSIATASGHLKCKQCNESVELFEWVQRIRTLATTWDACRSLAEDVGVTIEITKRKGKAPKGMTKEILLQAVNNLWTLPDAEPCREFLRRRKIASPEILEGMGVGYLAGYIVFAQFWPDGTLKSRYLRFSPGAPRHLQWSWSPGKGSAQGLWPHFTPPHDSKVILLEGQWDVLTAWGRLFWHKQKLYTYTWTGGVKAIPPGLLPPWIRNRRVEICYDNDTFQGPDWSLYKAPNDKKRAEMQRRRDAMLQTAKSLEMLGCSVFLKAIPVSPAENWGGDFRDWVDAGGRDWDEVPSWTLKDLEKSDEVKAIECDFNGAYQLAGKKAAFPAVVQTLEEEGITIPIRSEIDCNMGGLACCQNCRVPEKFAGQIIEWKDYPDELVAYLLARDPEREVQRTLLGKPSACPYCRIRPLDYVTGCAWVAVKDDRDEVSDRELVVLSQQSPTLSGEIRIHGSVHHHKKHVVVNASKLEMRESTDIDLGKVAIQLHEFCPWNSDDVEKIDACVRYRADDMAANVTHIYGRPDLHIAAELLPHSVLWMEVDGHRKRGWLDISVMGSTSSGKSETFSKLFNYHGLGKIHTCMENVSRAGLTMGAISSGDRMRLKPGLFPRAHKKMLILDEFHIMVEEKHDHPMLHLQSARDLGTVGGIKIYGARQLPAAVRFGTIANWIDGRRDAFKFPCQHFLSLYGKPEALRRLDFGLIVDGEPSDQPSEIGHIWESGLTQATILRAWGQGHEHIRFLPDALERARQQIIDWGAFYAEELPLFTGAEKLFSLLRISIAVANVVFSHAKDDLKTVVVRLAHVEWAKRWLEHCWELSLYDQYSSSQFAKREVRKPFHVEAYFTTILNIKTADEALRLLDNFFGTLTLAEMSAYTGKDNYKTLTWSSELVRLGALEKSVTGNAFNTHWRLTVGAYRLLRNVLDLADEFPEAFHKRMTKMDAWSSMRAMEDEPNLTPLDLLLEKERDAWKADSDGETNIVGGPGSA